MKVNKEVIAFWVIGAILLFMGTAVENYLFEILAVIVISIGFGLAIFWNDLFKENKTNIEEKQNA